MLGLSYHPDVPVAVIDLIEHHGRRLGLSLDALERVGQTLDAAEVFIVACEDGAGAEFARAFAATGAAPPAYVTLVRRNDAGVAA